jgi:hypothetical protein
MRERVDLKSPVRENRPPGSVRGASGNRRPYLDGAGQARSSVPGENGHHALEDEPAGADAALVGGDQRVEGMGDIAGGFARDVDPVMGKERLEGVWHGGLPLAQANHADAP